MDEVTILRRAYPFQDMTAAELEPLLSSFRRRPLKREEAVWNQGDRANELWFVLSGQVRGIVTGEGGSEVVTGVFGPGESFGEIGLFMTDQTRWASCVASVPSLVLSLPREPLLRFLEAHPPALRRMLESLSRMAWMQSMAFREVAFRDIRGRIAWRLLDLAQRHGEPIDGGTRITLKLSQATLAGMVAASRENVSRAMAAFTMAGDIRRQAGQIIVVNAEALRTAAGSHEAWPWPGPADGQGSVIPRRSRP